MAPFGPSFFTVSGRPGTSAGLPPAAVSVVPRNEGQRVRKMVIGSMGWHRLSPPTEQRPDMPDNPSIRPEMAGGHHFELPRSRDLFRRAVPQILEAILVPLGLFYAALSVLGPKGAICTALAWNFAALLRRLWRRERLPGVLLLGTVGLTARSVVALVSSSSLFVYFLQPSLGTALLGGAFLVSVPLGCPLAEKLAHDFVPLPPSFFKRPKVRQLFIRISLLWALVSLTNAAGTIALLLNVPIATFLPAKTGLSWALTVAGIVLSSWWFRRGLRRANAEAVTVGAE